MAYFPHYVTLWVTHGPVCGRSNVAAMETENARAAAGVALARVASALSENLLTAAGRYERTDDEQQDILDEQMQS